jgi:serine/threonine protein kinase
LARDSSSVLKIADFGVSKELHFNPMRTCCGSPDYIAPEIITQKEGYDGKLADLWVRIFAEALICPPLCTRHCPFRRLLLAVDDMFCPAVVRSDLLCDDGG